MCGYVKNYKENMNFKTEFKPVFIFQVVLNFKKNSIFKCVWLT